MKSINGLHTFRALPFVISDLHRHSGIILTRATRVPTLSLILHSDPSKYCFKFQEAGWREVGWDRNRDLTEDEGQRACRVLGAG